MSFIRLLINKEATLKDLMDKIANDHGIPSDNQKILKKNNINPSAGPEVLTNPYNLDRKIAYIRVYEGSVLYVEHVEAEDAESKWALEFEKEASRYLLKFNSPAEPVNSVG